MLPTKVFWSLPRTWGVVLVASDTWTEANASAAAAAASSALSFELTLGEALEAELKLSLALALELWSMGEALEAELPLALELSLMLALELRAELVLVEGPTAEPTDDSVMSGHKTLLADAMVEPQRTTHSAARRKTERAVLGNRLACGWS